MSASHSKFSVRRALPMLLMALLCGWFAPAAFADIPAVPTQNNDNARTGANLNETILTPANVNITKFGKLFTRSLDANVNGQVLYVPNLSIKGGVHNVIFAYTSNNSNNSSCSVYAFDADDPAASTALWRHQFTNSAQWTTCAPVIDTTNNILYVLTKDNNDSGATRLRALDLLTGSEKQGSPITIAASVPGTGDGSRNGVVTFNTAQANCRPGLLLLNGIVYFAFAHNTDSFPYQGWVFGYSYDGTKFTQTAVFNAAPNGGDAGIWQAGKGLTADLAGNIYCSVGNGTFTANSGGKDYGMCYLKLSTPNLTVTDWFAPYDELSLSDQDLDLGNTGLVGIPGTTRLFAGATKFGTAFLLDSTDMGKFTPNGPDKVLQRLNGISNNNNVGQNPIAWDAGTTKYVYLWPNGYNLQQFKYDTSVNKLNPAGVYKQAAASSGGSLAITANGSANGILWAAGNDGVFHAFDASDLSKPELWNSGQNNNRDNLGSVGHFQFPTVVNGKAYVPTNAGTIAVYGLLNSTTVSSYQINSGGGAVGQFSSDVFNNGGITFTTGNGIDLSGVTNPAPMSVYQSCRYNRGTPVVYTLPNLTPSAAYTVRLHFAEPYFTTTNQRLFNIGINGSTAISNFDVVAAAGGAFKAVAREVHTTADSNGTITVTLTSVMSDPFINGLEVITPAVYRINAGSGAVSPFMADQFNNGGITFTTGGSIDLSGVTDPAPMSVYQSCRYSTSGPVVYTLPNLTPGATYTVRLHFAEPYFTSSGQRLFNIGINGSTAISNFDVFTAAGGAFRAVARDVTATADTNGKITVTLTSVVSDPFINGLEVK